MARLTTALTVEPPSDSLPLRCRRESREPNGDGQRTDTTLHVHKQIAAIRPHVHKRIEAIRANRMLWV
jgi:hypothetical protein